MDSHVAEIVTWAEAKTAQPPTRTGGRPTLLTDALTAEIAALVMEGHYIETVCQSMGISKQTYYNWLERGQADIDANPLIDTLHSRFLDAVKTAEGQAEIQISRDWLHASEKGWLKYATFASRRFRKHWHDKEPEQHNTFVQNTFQLMPGQAGYVVPALPPAIEADVLSPPVLDVVGEGV